MSMLGAIKYIIACAVWPLAIIASCILFRIVEFLGLAFTSYSGTAHLVGRLSWIFLCIYLIVRFFRQRKLILVVLTIVSGVVGFLRAESLDLRKALAAIYAAEIQLTSDYGAQCKPPEGVTGDAVLKLCESRDWDVGERTVAVLYVQGDPTPLTMHGLDSPPRGRPFPFRNFLPFGMSKYEASHICDQYYLVIFENTVPASQP